MSKQSLKNWFLFDVEKSMRQAILAKNSNNPFRHVLAYIISRLSKNESAYVEGNGPAKTLSRTCYFVRKNDFARAVEEMDTLTGFQKTVCGDWENEAKRYLELKQLLDVTKTFVRMNDI
ncbi:hypothetical protein MHBO_003498 [Bonamia ostreae]|uniref:Uncharacterized protein n=1 Tax=Bonamia ostreae TaxID=126728 RepID=A0ABV2AR85_9EUKA